MDAPAPATAVPPARLREDTSEAQLRLLSAFLVPSRLEDWLSSWQSALGESPRNVFDRWIAAGMLKPASATAVVAALWPLMQLRAQLHERGLQASGTKVAMAARLLEADPAVMAPAAKTPYYLYAGDASELRRRVPLAQRPKPPKFAKTAWQHMQERNIAGAVRSVAAYHAAGIFPMGRAAQWANPRHWRDMAQLLALLFASWPRIVDDVPFSARGPYRVAAGMMALFDTRSADEWISPSIPGHPRLLREAVARMVLYAAEHELRRKRWRSDDVAEVRLVFPSDACPACSAMHDRVFNVRMLPELPLADCVCDGGSSGEIVAEQSPLPRRRLQAVAH